MIEHTCHVLRSRLDHTSETNDRIERNEPYQTLDYPSFLTLRTVARQWSRHELEWRADRFYFHLYPSILILLEIFIHSKRIISDICFQVLVTNRYNMFIPVSINAKFYYHRMMSRRADVRCETVFANRATVTI